mmetsp:Transcript_7345/g.26250  ORF Transcript_7345/g.26250 Transcript_7345/m.26250 type:complete len:205 (+) Transcript_7345:770-1384(+)
MAACGCAALAHGRVLRPMHGRRHAPVVQRDAPPHREGQAKERRPHEEDLQKEEEGVDLIEARAVSHARVAARVHAAPVLERAPHQLHAAHRDELGRLERRDEVAHLELVRHVLEQEHEQPPHLPGLRHQAEAVEEPPRRVARARPHALVVGRHHVQDAGAVDAGPLAALGDGAAGASRQLAADVGDALAQPNQRPRRAAARPRP